MDQQRIIEGFERYIACTDSTIWDTKTRKCPTVLFCVTGKSYYVMLYQDGLARKQYIARVILQTFIPIAQDKSFCPEWIDGNRSNNALTNLRWKHRSSHTCQLTESNVRLIRKRWMEGWTLQRLADKFGTSLVNIDHIVNNKTWTWVKAEAEE